MSRRIEKTMTQGIDDVVSERRRQVATEGWSAVHDNRVHEGALALAGACYALRAFGATREPPDPWPFDREWWKPKNPRRNLVRAAALIIAEIDRMDRINEPISTLVDGAQEVMRGTAGILDAIHDEKVDERIEEVARVWESAVNSDPQR